MSWSGFPSGLSLTKTGLRNWSQRRSKRNSKIPSWIILPKYWREGNLRDWWSKVTSANVWDTITTIRYSYHEPKFELAASDPNGCIECREIYMWYPEFIFHPCNSIMRIPWSENIAGGEHKTLSVSKEYKGYGRCKWTSEHLHFDDRASRTVINILNACGLDWEKTTVAYG